MLFISLKCHNNYFTKKQIEIIPIKNNKTKIYKNEKDNNFKYYGNKKARLI